MSELPVVYSAGGKYNNSKVEVDGYTFDSMAEYRRYVELKMLAQAGTITELIVHPLYELQPAFRTADGKRERAICYEGDFEYQENGQWIVEDVKGQETDVWKLKRKLFLANYPTAVLRVTPAGRYSKKGR
jgi:hypothetical protein